MRTLIQTSAITFLTLFSYAPATIGSGVTIDTKGVGVAAAEILKPIVEALTQEVAAETAAFLKVAIANMSQKNICKKTCGTMEGVTCAKVTALAITKRKVALCKDQCQQTIPVGAQYSLKIRYTEPDNNGEGGWSLFNCIQRATRNGAHEVRPELNKYSIAIYSKQDYDIAITQIARIVALNKFVLLGGKVPGNEDKSKEDLDKLVKEAEIESEELDQRFQKYVHVDKKLGPQ